MSSNPYDPNTPPPPYNAQTPPYNYPPAGAQAVRRSRKTYILAFVAALLVICGASAFLLVNRAKNELTAARETVHQFMQAGARNDSAAGFDLIAQAARGQGVSEDDIISLFERRKLFEGYQAVTTGPSFEINSSTDEGTTAALRGTISYSSGPEASFNSRLRKEDGRWRLLFIELDRNQ